MTVAVIVVAAGRGLRAGGEMPKQYRTLCGQSVLARTLAAFDAHPAVSMIQPVISPSDLPLYERSRGEADLVKLLLPASGGETRQQSVLAGLEALVPHAPRLVLIHDAARPLVPADVIGRTVEALSAHPACLAALPLADTLKRGDADGRVEATLDRRSLWRAQTPQGFHFAAILAAHRAAAAEGLADFTDDAAIAEWRGLEIALVQGSERNFKLTTPEDFRLAERMLAAPGGEPRTGSGFDVHAFEPGDHVMLCGVRLPYDQGLKGHSDADVGLHALTDALLGALAAGDIGDHFPPSDMRWKAADSAVFLRHAAHLVAARSGRILHVDVTLICERPKIGPHKAAMRARIAEILGIAENRVSVKATTTEGLGFTGRREGIAAMASATVELGEDADA